MIPFDFFSRKQWNAKPVLPLVLEQHIPSKVTFHHFVGFEPDFSAKQMYGFYGAETMLELQDNGMKTKCDDIRYHIILDRLGRIWEGRELTYMGSHVKSNNRGNIGILCYGNFEVETPTDLMIQAIKKTIIGLKILFPYLKIPQCIYNHREFTFTECPGKNLCGIINDLKFGKTSIYEGLEL